jgi:signal transduction histidine kinase
MYFVLQALEAERQTLRHPRVKSPPGHGATRASSSSAIPVALERLAAKVPKFSQEMRGMARKIQEQASKSDDRLRRLEEGYAELAALGQAAAGASEAVRPHLDRVREEADRLQVLFREMDGLGINQSLERIQAAADAMRMRIAMFAPMENAGTRRRTIDLHAEVYLWAKLLEPLRKSRQVTLKIESRKSRRLVRTPMLPETFHRLMQIFASNSFDWLQSVKKPRVVVRVRKVGDLCEILFSDNGRGMPAGLEHRVFEPLFSRKEGGRGMGLTIAKTIVGRHGGQISVVIDRRRRGATLRVLLPSTRARATVHRH